MKSAINIILIATTVTMTGCSIEKKSLNIEAAISKMSIEDKAHFVIGTGMKGTSGNNAVIGTTENLVPGAAGTTYPLDSLGIPAIVLADGPAGLRIDATRPNDSNTYYCTHFPIGTLLASTWNIPLIEQVGKAIGEEVKAYGVDVLLAPAMNIQRNALCGRNFEYYSEDPVIAGKTAAAYVRGVQQNGVGTSIKHFCANNQETNRTNNNACISQRALREIYLKPFEIAVKESEPWTVMTSYNYLNGIYTSQNPELLQGILREEWGFKGTVMTDWFGGINGAEQIAAGNDMLQPGREKQFKDIVNGIKSKRLSETDLDNCVRRIMKLIEKTPRFNGYKATNKPNLSAHTTITRQSATEGMVLLKNDNTALPFSKDVKNIALFGCTSYDFIAGGTGSGNVNHAYVVSLVEGLKNANMAIDNDLATTYAAYIKEQKKVVEHANDGKPFAKFLPTPRPEELSFGDSILMAKAKTTDAAIITIGRLSGEFVDRKTTDFNLTFNEHKLIADVSRIYHAANKKVIVLLNIGGVIETASWKEQPDAILCAWQAGQEGGNSVADVLTGKTSPSGKLTMTWPIGYADNASSNNFPINQEPDLNMTEHGTIKNTRKDYDYTNYEEDVFVGYRYFTSFNIPVSYPFGYGLSYTTFTYSDATISRKGDTYELSVKITNTGKTLGKEVVQLYYNDPESKKHNKPEIELKAYTKTKMLKPGESQTVNLRVNIQELASFDDAKSQWVVNGTKGRFLIGAASNDIRAILTADVTATSRKVANLLLPQHPLKLLHR